MEEKQLTIVVGVIVNHNGEILLAKRNQPQTPQIHGKWEFPGGGIDFGEMPEEALLREVTEETGLEVEIKSLLPKVFSNMWQWPEGERQVIILSYECVPNGGSLGSSDEEIGELKYFKTDEIDFKNCLPHTKEIIDLLKP